MPDIPGTPDNAATGSIDLDVTAEQTPPLAPPPAGGKPVCIEQSKFDHKTKCSGRQLEMIQRSVCATWFHTDCVGIKKDVQIGVWPCTTCRLIPDQIKHIVDTLGTLTRTVNTITATNANLSTQYEKKELECIALRKENANLLTQIASLNAKLSKRTWEFFTQKPTLLIGDSLI